MKLSEYCDKKETLWYKVEQENVENLIKYINNNIDDDLFKIANTNDSVDVFNKLKVWLFKLYNKELLEDDSLGIRLINEKARSITFKRTLGVNNLIVEL